jgi:hypothetical protein
VPPKALAREAWRLMLASLARGLRNVSGELFALRRRLLVANFRWDNLSYLIFLLRMPLFPESFAC